MTVDRERCALVRVEPVSAAPDQRYRAVSVSNLLAHPVARRARRPGAPRRGNPQTVLVEIVRRKWVIRRPGRGLGTHRTGDLGFLVRDVEVVRC